MSYYSSSHYTPTSLRKYGSGSSSYSSYSRSSYLPSTYYSGNSSRPFTSRFLKSRYLSSSDEETETEDSRRSDDAANNNRVPGRHDEGSLPCSHEDGRAYDRPTVLNGSVVRIRRRQESSSSEDSDDDEATRAEEESGEQHDSTDCSDVNDANNEPEVVEVEEEEDALDKEERELNQQLLMSVTLTMVDEENIRQRLLEIRKSRLRKDLQEAVEENLVRKFQKVTDLALLENHSLSGDNDEEQILIRRIETAEMTDVDRKDAHVRLQEIFRDQRNAFDKSIREVELSHEHILQETTTELTELENSIRCKSEQVEKLQGEILSMTVRKELLVMGMQAVNQAHEQKAHILADKVRQIESKMSQFAVVVVQAHPAASTTTLATSAMNKSGEMLELERELECPVCMDIARPPIYQCEQGHVICCRCKPLLTSCPHNCGSRYSDPPIRCRFAEKLAEKYLNILALPN